MQHQGELHLDSAQLRVLERLARAMELNSGFAFHVLLSSDPELLGPASYHAAYLGSEATGEALELRRFDHEHLEQLPSLLDHMLANNNPARRCLIIIDLSGLPANEWARASDLFTSLSQRRDRMRSELRGELLLCAPQRIEQDMLAAGPDLASAIRTWTLPRSPVDSRALTDWLDACDQRFASLLQSQPDAPARYQHGTYTFAYTFEPDLVALYPGELRDALAAVPGYTGWRPWWVPTNEHAPRQHEGGLECWLFGGEHLFPDPAHSDYWRASTSGQLYLRRGYDEDSTSDFPPGQLFSSSLAIWRLTEALLHVRDFSRQLSLADHRRVALAARWDGLAGRALSTWPEKFPRHHKQKTTTSLATAQLAFELAELSDDLEAVVTRLVDPLYQSFPASERPSPAFIASHIHRLLTRRG